MLYYSGNFAKLRKNLKISFKRSEIQSLFPWDTEW